VLRLRFEDGTLVIDGLPEDGGVLSGLCVWDGRVRAHRAQAINYAPILRRLHGKLVYEDGARAYAEVALHEAQPRAMRPYQQAALGAWEAAQRRGVVVLPTGAGKSYVALKAMLACRRSALVLAPTIDLVVQWAADLQDRLGIPVGQYGGGEKRLEDVTVATYDSAVLFMPWKGNRFGLVVFDECHHLPAGVTSTAATMCIAPFRLGLTATPERADGLDARLDELVGPIVHRTRIDELEGSYLASYQAEVVEVAMDPDEAVAYQANRREYLAFLRLTGVDLGQPDGWAQFLSACGRDAQGRAALRAWREQKRLVRASRAKLRAVWELLREHAGERTIIFTDDNDTAYAIGRQMILPVLTHHTRPAERKGMLASFRAGTLPVLVTSKVLNEGVDVPEASVAIVVSGSGSVREHVQRLGRILRPRDGKVAQLYELVSAGTAEGYTSERRRSHAAFGENSWRDY
jgi:superfamily II DNA or RNA helicase